MLGKSVYCRCWEDCSINVNETNVVDDGIFQVYISNDTSSLIFYLLVLLVLEREMLASPTIYVDFSLYSLVLYSLVISFLFSVFFCFGHLKNYLHLLFFIFVDTQSLYTFMESIWYFNISIPCVQCILKLRSWVH